MISLLYPWHIRGIFLYVADHISILFPIKPKEDKNILQVELLAFKPLVYILLFRFQKDCPHAQHNQARWSWGPPPFTLHKEGTYHASLPNGHWHFGSAFIYTPWFNKYKHLKIFWISFPTKIYATYCPDACLTATLPFAKVSVFNFLLKWIFLKYGISTVSVKVPFCPPASYLLQAIQKHAMGISSCPFDFILQQPSVQRGISFWFGSLFPHLLTSQLVFFNW